MTIEQRLAKLERSNLAWRRSSFCLVMVVFALLAMGQKEAQPGELTVRKLVVVDSMGRHRIVVGGELGEPNDKFAAIQVYNKDKELRYWVASYDAADITNITLADAKGNRRISQSVDREYAYTTHFDPAAKSRVAIGTGGATAGMMLNDNTGKLRLSVSTLNDGSPSMAVYDKNEKVRNRLYMDVNNSILNEYFDAAGLARLRLAVDKGGVSNVVHFDRKGIVRLNQLGSLDGTAGIGFFDANGRLTNKLE